LNDKTKAHIGLVATNIFFAANLTAVKYLTGNGFMKPTGMNVVRAAVCVMLFWAIFAFRPSQQKIDKKDRGRFFLCALMGIAINQMLFLKGLSLTYPVHAALLMLTTPVLITFIAAWLLKEKLSRYKFLGLCLSLTGAAVLISARQGSGAGTNILLGDIYVIINAVSYAFYFVLVKPLMLKYNPLLIIRWIFTLGLLMMVPFGWQEFIEIKWASFSFIEYACIILIAVFGTFLAYLFNIYGISRLGASVAGAYIYLQPVFATFISMIFLKEGLELYKLAAAVLIFAGVYLCNRQVKAA
jgi:drug/metabolite transporter (DMT)-like permease